MFCLFSRLECFKVCLGFMNVGVLRMELVCVLLIGLELGMGGGDVKGVLNDEFCWLVLVLLMCFVIF